MQLFSAPPMLKPYKFPDLPRQEYRGVNNVFPTAVKVQTVVTYLCECQVDVLNCQRLKCIEPHRGLVELGWKGN